MKNNRPSEKSWFIQAYFVVATLIGLLLLVIADNTLTLNMVASFCVVQILKKILTQTQELSLLESAGLQTERDVVLGESFRESVANIIN
jgi:hypothetical protein